MLVAILPKKPCLARRGDLACGDDNSLPSGTVAVWTGRGGSGMTRRGND
jgi:hypothetical protein